MTTETKDPGVISIDPVSGLPSTAYRTDEGDLRWKVQRTTEGGSKYMADRPLATTLKEARDNRWDFCHPTLGVVWEGYKLGSDRPPQQRMADTSVGGMVPPGGRPVPGSETVTEQD